MVRRPIPELSGPGRISTIVEGLLPSNSYEDWNAGSTNGVIEKISLKEIKTLAHCLPRGKAPGPDGVPDTIVLAVALARSDKVAGVFNCCLENGIFLLTWKTAKLVLIRKPGKPLNFPFSYRPLSLINTTAKLFERVIKSRSEEHIFSLPDGLSDQ